MNTSLFLTSVPMTEVTQILSAIERGDPQAAAQLLPLVYDELRKLAAQKMAQEKPGQTLSPTALVHEAYLRLVGDQQFDNRGHFFAAAAEAMRRILVEKARREVALELAGDGHASISTVRLPLRRNGTTNCSPWTQRLSDSRSSNPRQRNSCSYGTLRVVQ